MLRSVAHSVLLVKPCGSAAGSYSAAAGCPHYSGIGALVWILSLADALECIHSRVILNLSL